MTHNPPIVVTVKLSVKMKNLFRLKDGLGPCIDALNPTKWTVVLVKAGRSQVYYVLDLS